MTMKRNRLIGLVIGLAVVAAIAGSAWYWTSRVDWPQFAASANSNQPQVIAVVVPPSRNQFIDQDYAYHIGDLVTVDIFARQQKGTVVDPATLSVGGDFELAEIPSVTERKNADDTIDYRIRVKLQSFKPLKELNLKATVAWKPIDGERKEVSIPKTSVFWSNTYDGRKKLKEGNDPRIPAYWYTLRHAVPLALSSLFFLTVVLVSVRNYLRNRPVPVDAAVAMARVNELVSRIGTLSKAEHLELDGIVREHYGVGPVPASQLDGLSFEGTVVAFLKLNAPAVYAEDALSKEDASKLHLAAQRILRRW